MANLYMSYQIISVETTPEEQELEGEIEALTKIIFDKQNKLTKLREGNISEFIKLHADKLKILPGALFYNSVTNFTYFIEDKALCKVKEC